MNITDYEFLLPGHVFTREDGSSSRLLFITNTSLSTKAQKKFPPQVVYADENDNIFSRDIRGFLETREFFNVDPELEAKLKALLLQTGEYPEDQLDLDGDDSLVISDPDDIDDMLARMSAGGTGDEETEPEDPAVIGAAIPEMSDVEADMEDGLEDTAPSVTYVAVNSGLPANLTAEQLSEATASYQQSPNLANGNTQHILFIRADEGITKALLEASFSPQYQDQSTLYTPLVQIEDKIVTIDWDALVGIYPATFYGSRMYQVILESFPVQDDGLEVADEAPAMSEAGELEVTEAPVAVVAEVVGIAVPAPAPVAVAQPAAVVVNAAPAAVVVNAAPAPAVQVSTQ